MLASALAIVAACGFQPVYQNTGSGAALLSNISAIGGDDDQLMRRALARAIGVGEGAIWSADIMLDEKISESQLDEQGIAQRLRLDMTLELHLTDRQTGAQRVARFVETQYMSGNSDSAAGDMMRRQTLKQLAVQNLADKAGQFIRNLQQQTPAQDRLNKNPETVTSGEQTP